MTERWLPVVGFEGFYSVSNLGRVRSEYRVVIRSNGAPFPCRQQLLRPGRKASGHLTVALTRDGICRSYDVHTLVAAAFIGPRPPGMEVRHYDDNGTNNHAENLSYGTRSENQLDAVRNGRHAQAAKTECVHGHEYTPENTGRDRGQRYCRRCRIIRNAAKRALIERKTA